VAQDLQGDRREAVRTELNAYGAALWRPELCSGNFEVPGDHGGWSGMQKSPVKGKTGR
jgi:hypothetical protein